MCVYMLCREPKRVAGLSWELAYLGANLSSPPPLGLCKQFVCGNLVLSLKTPVKWWWGNLRGKLQFQAPAKGLAVETPCHAELVWKP